MVPVKSIKTKVLETNWAKIIPLTDKLRTYTKMILNKKLIIAPIDEQQTDFLASSLVFRREMTYTPRTSTRTVKKIMIKRTENLFVPNITIDNNLAFIANKIISNSPNIIMELKIVENINFRLYLSGSSM